jgi:hypothetical protein
LTYLVRAEQQLENHESPQDSVRAALDAFVDGGKVTPMFAHPEMQARAYLVLARHAILSGTSARHALDQARTELDRLRAQESEADLSYQEAKGRVMMVEAEEQIRAEIDPQKSLNEARQAFRTAMTKAPKQIDFSLCLAQLEYLAAKHALAKGQATLATFEAIRDPLQSWVKDKPTHPEVYALLAASHVLAAEWRRGRRQSPD